MGRDSTGKHQEDAAVAQNNQQKTADYAKRDTSVGGYNKSVDSLEATPGYSPTDLQSMRAEQGDQISAVYGNQNEQLRRNAAETGNANDAGLYSQMRATDDQRARDVAMGNNSIAGKQAGAVLDTRRMLPSMRFQPAALYSGNTQALGQQNASLVNQRQQVDQTTPLWAQIAQTGMQAAGQAATGGLAGCWIAEALFGEHSWRTRLLRSWLNHEFKQTRVGSVVMALYLRYGRAVAYAAQRSSSLRRMLRPLFNFALSRAIVARGI